MRRVLLVDDEPRALSGIRRTFPWEAYGFEVVLETTDPAEALRALRQGGIDLALVDIRMPEISGLDLIRAARADGVETDFILVSGYAEFDFARDALRLGVLDYCLKPVKSEAAAEILKKAAQRLDRADRERRGILPADIEKNPGALAEHFTTPLPLYQAVVSATDGGEPAEIPLPRGVKAFRAVYGPEAVHVLNLAEPLQEPVPLVVPLGQRVGIGGACRCLEDVPSSIGQAREALQGTVIHPERTLFLHRPAHGEEVETAALGILGAIAEDDLAGLQDLFARLPGRIRGEDWTVADLERLQDRLCTAIQRPAATGAGDHDGPFSASAVRRLYGGLEGWCAHLARLCMDGEATTGFRAFHAARGNERLLQILGHVHAHLGEDLSLQEIARRFHLHPNYASSLFKGTVGVAFSEYVARVRLQKARSLLRGTAMPLAQVAAAVGWDYYHFIKAFTKREGLSPARFRRAAGLRPGPEG